MLKFYKKITLSCNRPLTKHSGFTLLEILLVIGIIAVLAGIVIIAINPSKTLATVRNTERKSDLKQIDSALSQYYIDNNEYPTSLTSISDLTEICDTGASTSSSELTSTCDTAGLINLSELVPTYLTAIPKDPSATTTSHAGYKVIRTGRKIGLSAPAELGQTITIGNVPETPALVDNCEVSGDATDPDCWSTDDIGRGYIVWGPTGSTIGTSGDTDGSVSQATWVNTVGNNASYPAFYACYNLEDDGYPKGTWYLPSKQQLTDAYGVVPGFQTHYYWSSTESSAFPATNAWYFYMNVGAAVSVNKGSPYTLVRCLR
jgi:prepilin-type N-terminal cleavage/methylation domain-containing protein